MALFPLYAFPSKNADLACWSASFSLLVAAYSAGALSGSLVAGVMK